MQLLPTTRSRALALVVAAVAAFYFCVTVLLLLNARQSLGALAAAPLFALLAWGIWKLSRFVRWVTVICLWLMVVMAPLGIINPDAASSLGDRAPHWTTMVAIAALFVFVGLLFLYVLGKHKREFKWP
jgi:hypothetical protein